MNKPIGVNKPIGANTWVRPSIGWYNGLKRRLLTAKGNFTISPVNPSIYSQWHIEDKP
jgi:hypothetical protein